MAEENETINRETAAFKAPSLGEIAPDSKTPRLTTAPDVVPVVPAVPMTSMPDRTDGAPPIASDTGIAPDATMETEYATDKRLRAERVAVKLLENKAAQWQSRMQLTDLNDMSDAEFALYVYGQLRNGFPEESYTTDGGPGKKINITADAQRVLDDGTTENISDVSILFLREGKKNDEGERVYTCTAQDPSDKTKTITVEVTGEELARRHFNIARDDIINNFTGAELKAVNGDELTDEELTKLEDSLDPEKIAAERRSAIDTVIQTQLDNIAQEIQIILAKKPEERTLDDKQKLQLQAGLALVQILHGEFGAPFRQTILEQIKNNPDNISNLDVNRALRTLKNETPEAQDKLIIFLESKGIAKEAIGNPDMLIDLLTSGKLGDSEQELVTGLFGDTSMAVIDSHINKYVTSTKDFIDALPAGRGQKIIEFLKRNPSKRAGLFLLILAAIPAVAGALAVGAGLQATGVMGGSRR